jgi:hypothetical protein
VAGFDALFLSVKAKAKQIPFGDDNKKAKGTAKAKAAAKATAKIQGFFASLRMTAFGKRILQEGFWEGRNFGLEKEKRAD